MSAAIRSARRRIDMETAALVNIAKDLDRHGLTAAAVLHCYAAAIRADLEKGTSGTWSEADLSDDQRRQIQRVLVDRGFLKPDSRNPDSIDGKLGHRTRAAIAAWHRQDWVTPASGTLTSRDAVALGIRGEGSDNPGLAGQPDCAPWSRRRSVDTKRVIGDTLRSRTHRRQVTEVAVATQVLNRMLEFGRPRSVRIA